MFIDMGLIDSEDIVVRQSLFSYSDNKVRKSIIFVYELQTEVVYFEVRTNGKLLNSFLNLADAIDTYNHIAR